MTLEELWELFPIALSSHKSCWGDWYEEERKLLASLLGGMEPAIYHIGSTAIQGIWAKPIIDILVEIPTETPLTEARACLVDSGYICMSEAEERLSLNKGYSGGLQSGCSISTCAVPGTARSCTSGTI